MTITHDLRLNSSTFFSANSITSPGQGVLMFIVSEYVTFPELLMDAHLNSAQNKLPVPAAIKLLNWKRLVRSPELTKPLPGGMTPLKKGFLSKIFVFLNNTEEREREKSV